MHFSGGDASFNSAEIQRDSSGFTAPENLYIKKDLPVFFIYSSMSVTGHPSTNPHCLADSHSTEHCLHKKIPLHAKLSISLNALFSVSQTAEHEAKFCTQICCRQP